MLFIQNFISLAMILNGFCDTLSSTPRHAFEIGHDGGKVIPEVPTCSQTYTKKTLQNRQKLSMSLTIVFLMLTSTLLAVVQDFSAEDETETIGFVEGQRIGQSIAQSTAQGGQGDWNGDHDPWHETGHPSNH